MASVGGQTAGNPQVTTVLNEARLLITRLHDRDKTADSLLVNVQTLNEKINCMREYSEDMEEFSKFSAGNEGVPLQPTQPPHGRSHLIHSLQQENRQIRLLQEENRQLKLALEEHQAALELIMQKHRRLMLRMLKLSKFQSLFEQLSEVPSAHGMQSAGGPDEQMRMRQFASVFDECLKMGESASKRDQQELARLTTENTVLRQLLRVGSINDARMYKLFANFLKDQAARDANLRWSMDSDDEDDSSTPVEPIAPAQPLIKPVDVSSSDNEAEITVIHANGGSPPSPQSPNAVPSDPPQAASASQPLTNFTASCSESSPQVPGETQTIKRSANKKPMPNNKKDGGGESDDSSTGSKPPQQQRAVQNGPHKKPPSAANNVGGKLSAFVKTTPFGRRKSNTGDEQQKTHTKPAKHTTVVAAASSQL